MAEHSPHAPNEIVKHYTEGGYEHARLSRSWGLLEYARTQEIIQRYLPPTGTIWDIGGGAGVYALWLAQLGYAVHLVDAVPLHVSQAQQASDSRPQEQQLASASTGDACALNVADHSADVVLLLGPLYHLTEREDRVQALREAYRILKPGGVMIAAGISRFASLISGWQDDLYGDPAFGQIVERDLQDGQHRNPDNHPDYFTTAFFHHPDELRAEAQDAGFAVEGPFGVEGPAWSVPNLSDYINDPVRWAQLLSFLRTIETEHTMLGSSAHLLVVGRKAESTDSAAH